MSPKNKPKNAVGKGSRPPIGDADTVAGTLGMADTAAGGLGTEETAAGPFDSDLGNAKTRRATSDDGGSTSRLSGKLGRYEILGVLGRGGMGIVHEALDPALNRKVAVKLLHDEDFSVGARTRLVREAQMMAKLSHPNVVTVYEVGSAEKLLYIAMEYVEGQNLGEWLQSTTHSWSQITDMFCEAGLGLAAAHKQGIVHRDFKPANVLVGADGRVLVTDFGIAHTDNAAEQQEETNPTSFSREVLADVDTGSVDMSMPLTVTGSLMGTGPYMAPELIQGESTSAASDQFAFCVAAWIAFYGALPFSGETPSEHLKDILSHPPRVTDKTRRLPKKIHRILVKGLSREPKDRYPSMEELIAELATLRQARQRYKVLGGVAVVAMAVGATWLVTSSQEAEVVQCSGGAAKLDSSWGQARQQAMQTAFQESSSDLAEANFDIVKRELDEYSTNWASVHKDACVETRIERTHSDEVLAGRMACLDIRRLELRALVNLFATGDKEVVAGSAAAVYQLPSPGECRTAEATSQEVPEELRGRVDTIRATLADAAAQEFAGRFREGQGIAAKALSAAQDIGYLPIESETLLVNGRLEWRAGDPSAARLSLIRAAATAMEADFDELRTEAWIELVWVVGYELIDIDEALAWQELATSSLRAARKPNLRLNAQLLSNMGAAISYRSERWAEGREYVAQALALRMKEFGTSHPIVAMAHNQLGALAFHMKDFDASREHVQSALAILEETAGSNHAGVAFAHNNLGSICVIEGDLEKAMWHFEKAVEIGTLAMGRNHSEVAVALSNLGVVALEQGDFEVALERMQEVLAIEMNRLGAEHPSVVASHENLAAVYDEAGDTDKAVEHCREAQKIRSSTSRIKDRAGHSEICKHLLE